MRYGLLGMCSHHYGRVETNVPGPRRTLYHVPAESPAPAQEPAGDLGAYIAPAALDGLVGAPDRVADFTHEDFRRMSDGDDQDEDV